MDEPGVRRGRARRHCSRRRKPRGGRGDRAPVGRRSVMGLGPALGYRALPLGEFNTHLNGETAVIVMLETAAGIDNADAIAAVPGIDVLLIGSGDLTTDYGIPGQVDHP